MAMSDDVDWPNAISVSNSDCDLGGCASLSSETLGRSSVPPMSTRMFTAPRVATFTWYSPVICNVGFRSGPPTNVAEPRRIWNRLVRRLYSPRSVVIDAVHAERLIRIRDRAAGRDV